MWNLLSLINKNLTVAIPVMMISGFIYGMFFNTSFLKNLILPFTFLMVYPMMISLKIKKVFETGDMKAQLYTQTINFLIIPFIAFGIGKVFFPENPYMALGLLLASLLPTSGMTISWTGFGKGNVEAAIKMTVIGLTLGSVAAPFYLDWLMGAHLELDLGAVAKQIGLIVFLPMAAGFLTQQYLIKKAGQQAFQMVWAPRFPPLSTIGVLGIVFIAIALKAGSIAAKPQMLIVIILPLFILYALNFFISTAAGKMFLEPADAIALVYGTVMRNLSIALAVAINTFGEKGADAAMVISIAYILQVQSAAWYAKYTDRIFRRPDVILSTKRRF